MSIRTLTTLLLFFITIYTRSQLLQNYTLEIAALNSGGDGVPLWLQSLEEGRWNQKDGSQRLVSFCPKYSYKPNTNWLLSAAGEINYNRNVDNLRLHRATLHIQYKFLKISIGRHTFAPIFDQPNNGSGSYLYGNNSRPINRITIGIPQYTALPGRLNNLEIRGGISHGRLDDHFESWSHQSVILHEKYFYLRFNAGRIKPYAGLNHSALLGGYRTDGTKIPIDYWKSFFAKSSDKIGGGDATNAAGAHMGLYDFGFYMENQAGSFHIYYQPPFADKSGMNLFARNKDQIAGISWTPAKSRFLRNLTIEWVNTAHQSGNGMPDAIITLNNGVTQTIIAYQLDDPTFRENLMTNLGVENPETYTKEMVSQYLQNNFNHGNQFGGRDGYMNNGTYPAGWTNAGYIMGSPLNLTQYQLSGIKNTTTNAGDMLIINDRYKAIHAGANGIFNSHFAWHVKITYSHNYGSYYQQYPGRYTWQETSNYFFKNGVNQLYTQLGFLWQPKNIKYLTLSADTGCDYGEILNNYGARIGLHLNF
ncbi:capsule assembly Wzi family protein [Geofilum sp. OHC36d9]|uniref:capsule assembly Wzi family protein n=1 Tax=Geofilum sp. OHC36d9 TaxID=3458413 RepID=UPI004033F23A